MIMGIRIPWPPKPWRRRQNSEFRIQDSEGKEGKEGREDRERGEGGEGREGRDSLRKQALCSV